jgi:O-antigen/teichoic acid export membrane protein
MRYTVGGFKPSSTAKLLIAGSAWTLSMQIVAKFSIVVSTIAAARVMGTQTFGFFAAIQAIALLANGIWDSGYSTMLLRDVAASKTKLDEDLKLAVVARLVFSPIWCGIYIVGCLALGVSGLDSFIATISIGVGAIFSSLTLLLNAGLHSTLRFRAAASSTSVGRLIVALCAILIVYIRPPMPLAAFAISIALGELATLAAQYRSLKLSFLRGRLEWPNIRSAVNRQREAIPYALNGLFVTVYNRMDVVLVTWLAGVQQAGLFAPASRIQDALTFIPATASSAIVPVASSRFAGPQDSSKLLKTALVTAIISVCMISPVILGITLLADSLFPALLGEDYLRASSAISVIVWSLVFISVAQPFFSIVVASGEAKLLNVAYGCALITALIGHLLLVPSWGAVGAAWVAVARDAVGAFVGVAVALRAVSRLQSAQGAVHSVERTW